MYNICSIVWFVFPLRGSPVWVLAVLASDPLLVRSCCWCACVPSVFYRRPETICIMAFKSQRTPMVSANAARCAPSKPNILFLLVFNVFAPQGSLRPASPAQPARTSQRVQMSPGSSLPWAQMVCRWAQGAPCQEVFVLINKRCFFG